MCVVYLNRTSPLGSAIVQGLMAICVHHGVWAYFSPENLSACRDCLKPVSTRAIQSIWLVTCEFTVIYKSISISCRTKVKVTALLMLWVSRSCGDRKFGIEEAKARVGSRSWRGALKDKLSAVQQHTCM